MFLKRIEINGFKSFANKTEILLNNTITGIVGPNGSGKSNIADAIRWVLGEQSSKNLRGNKMEDVIFNGTQSRAKKPFCEVSLIFDNEDGKIASEYSEIVITRRMFRNGESEYKLNNNIVRLKDIVEITRDTGIGKEGYSIIGQGKIDEILSSKPLQRRSVFEEAAGIMKFRARKEEAEKKLEKTNENLVRVEDILEELTSRLGPLEEQAEQTKKYLTLYERQRELDVNIYLMNEKRFADRQSKLSVEISQAEAELNRLAREFSEVSDEGDKLNKELDEAIEAENRMNEQAASLTADIERFEGEKKLIAEKSVTIERDMQRSAEEINGLKEQIAEIDRQLEDKHLQIAEIDEEIVICDEGIEEVEKKRTELAKLSESCSGAMTAAKTRQLDIMSQLSSRNSQLAGLNAQSEGADGRKKDVELRLERVLADSNQRRKLIEKANERIDGYNREKAEISAKINENNVRIMRKKEAAKSVEDAYNEAQSKLTDARGRLRLMSDLKNEYDGYNDSVRNLMKAVKGRDDLKNRILGTVAELISVPKEYETAIEAYMGASLQNIVVKNEYDAKKLIELLHREKLGRITFLPVSSLKVTYFSNDELKELKRHDGFIAPAYEVLEYSDEVAPAIEFLLSKAAITRDLDSSIEIMRALDQSIKTVTLSGDINRAGGVMTGGSMGKKSFGLLSRERLMAELSQKISELEAGAEKKKLALDAENAAIEEMRAGMQSVLDELKAVDINLAEERERVSSYISLLEGCEANERALKNQINAIEIENKRIVEDAQKTKELIDYLNAEAEKVAGEIISLEEGSADHSKEIAKLSDEVNDKRIRRAELSKEKQAFTAECDRLLGEKDKNEKAMASKRNAIESMNAQSFALKDELEHTEDAAEEARRKLEELKEESAQISDRRRELRSLVVEGQRAVTEYQEQKTALMERRIKLEAQIDKVSTAAEAARTKLWEDYELTLASAEPMRIEIGYGAATKECEEVRGKIRELGTINPKAIEEYEEVSERTANMQQQREDLLKAEDDLAKVIDDLMAGMRSTFEEKFEQINVHFQQIFKELFGGGRAELRFEEGDVLEAGIDIVAEPPGKKLQQLSLLSGGERALTAIALLFAMIRINPSPVCLLDEIDAPLDEANAVRFADYIVKIPKTQFMVITHRKPTMTACNALYGVTMEEKGVSRMVSVQIDKKEA